MKRFAVLGLLCCCLSLYAQELPRRVFLGIRMDNLTADTRKVMGVNVPGGVLISGVLPASTAESAGFKSGDILLTINHKQVGNTNEVFAALAGYQAGDALQYELLRNNKAIKGKGVFRSFPKESYQDLEMIYTAVNAVSGTQRVMITKPKTTAKLPAVVFIGGIGCYSLDNALDTLRSESQLLNNISRSGFLCARPEKPGMGDNAKHSKPCSEVSFEEELDGYVQTVLALKKRTDVDSTAIYLIGHSMGGVFAPLVAQRTGIKGIIAYGTIGCNFLEHLAKTRRTIAEANEWTPEETDAYIKNFCECVSVIYTEKMSTEEAAKKKPECSDHIALFDLRSRAYMNELFALNIAGAWKPFTGKALLVWGESDYISARDDHRILTDAINYYHSGNAQLLTIPHADHGMQVAASFNAATKRSGPYQPEVGKAMLNWLNVQQGVARQ